MSTEPSRPSSTAAHQESSTMSSLVDTEKFEASSPITSPRPTTPENPQSAPTPAPAPAAHNLTVPDGGLVAWLQVLGSFFLFMDSWGIVNSFGAFQTFYQNDFLSHENPSNISWVGSLQGCLLLLVGVSSGPLFDLGYFRSLIIAGSVLVVLGMMLTSLCTRYWHVVLAQGVVFGIGSGMLFVPSVAIVATYFDRRKAFATGIAASGSSIGGVVFPVLFRNLEPRIGFAWTIRVIGFIALGTLALSVAIMRVRVQPRAVRRMLDLSAFRERPYLLYTIGSTLSFVGVYIPFYYIDTYASQVIGVDPSLAFYLVAIINAGSTFGRIFPNFFADRTGPFNMLIPCCLISAILALAWIRIESFASLIAFAALYGFFSGTFVSLPFTVLVTLTPDLGVLGARLGMFFGWSGIGVLIGNPVAGAILSRHGWVGLQAFCGASVLVAGIFIIMARMVKFPKVFVKA